MAAAKKKAKKSKIHPVEINIPQGNFLQLPHKFRGFVGGYGSSKTYSGCLSLCQHFYKHPGIDAGYFAPTYFHIRDIFYETIDEVAHSMGLTIEVKAGNYEVYVKEGRRLRGVIKCRSLERPERIVGFKIGHALVDEIDLLPMDKAQIAFRKVIARMRYNEHGLKNGVDITTTPEGFKFAHKLFVSDIQKNPELKKSYAMVQASTYDNRVNLPDDYIPSLLEAYPEELIQAYLHGQFVNLTSGTVYRAYKREVHRSKERMKDREPLFIGMDFNVQHMAATVYVQRPDGWHAVAELKDMFDTPDMIQAIQQKWQTLEGGKHSNIIIYPDPSGRARETVDASRSDISLLQAAKFTVRAKSKATLIKDRVNATNKAFADGWLHINDALCPRVAECLEQQAYDTNGMPDKTTGFDHQNDATTYPVVFERPIKRRYVVGQNELVGFWG